MATCFEIPAITFNGCFYRYVELTDSAERHFITNSEHYFRYVANNLNGENWKSTELGTDGYPEYITASITAGIKGVYADSDFRQTCFRVFPEKQTIQFFHGCSIRKEQYERTAHKMILQLNSQ